MTLKAIIAADLSAVFLNANELGESVTYTPEGEDGTSIVAIVNRDGTIEEDSGSGMEQDVYASLLIQVADVTTPGRGDTVTFDSFTWGVVGWENAVANQAWRVRVYRRNVLERSAGGHRLERG